MSPFSSVDASDDPAALVGYLATTAAGLVAMKHYMAAAAGRAVPRGLVLDIGCGAGHDLVLLAASGLRPVGVDPSAVMLAAARGLDPPAEPVPLVRADGRRLPFRARAFDGCRIERVLQHVDDPGQVVAEAARVIRPGGVLTVFEPDWGSLRFGPDVDGSLGGGQGSAGQPTDRDVHRADRSAVTERESAEDDRAVAGALVHVRRPDVAGRLDGLAATHGLRVVDRVTELSFAHAIADHPLPIEAALTRAVARGRIDAARASRWWSRQQELDRAGRFRASWAKVLLVAHREA